MTEEKATALAVLAVYDIKSLDNLVCFLKKLKRQLELTLDEQDEEISTGTLDLAIDAIVALEGKATETLDKTLDDDDGE